MRRLIKIIFLLTGPFCSAQVVVNDPLQIAASALNVADQIDYAIDQLGELADLGDKLNTVRQHVDDVFGDDGVGGKAISLMQDLGTLERLTQTYNRTLKVTAAYASRMKDTGKYRLSDVNSVLMYLNSSKNTAEAAVKTAKKILVALGFSKKEKKDELDKLISELTESLLKIETAMEIELEASIMAEGLTEMVDVLDAGSTAELYVEELSEYGSETSAARSGMSLMNILIGLLGLMCAGFGFLVYMRGGISGDPTAENILLRVGVALIGTLFIINIIESIINVSL